MSASGVHSQDDVRRYLETASGELIVQEYVPGIEFGVFYCRFPNEERGRVISITEKRLPEITADGHSTVQDLILNDSRAVCIAKTYLRNLRRDPASVPLAGDVSACPRSVRPAAEPSL
jgi:hypothetical protein